jgi:hypothetical protein
VVAEPEAEVFAPASEVELSLGGAVAAVAEGDPVVAEPEAVSVAAVAEVFAPVSEAELSPEAVASAAEPEVSVLAFAGAELSLEASGARPEALVPLFADAEFSPEVVASDVQPDVSAPLFAGVEPPHEVVSAAQPDALVLVSEDAEPEAVSVAADVAEPQVSGDIVAAFAVSVLFSVVVGEAGSPEHPMFFVFPNVAVFARSSSFVEVVG